MDEKNLKQQILDSIDDTIVPDYSSLIVAKHLERESERKHGLKKLWFTIVVPSLVGVATAAVIITTTLASFSNVNVAKEATAETYSVSTLSLANVISVSKGNITSFKDDFEKRSILSPTFIDNRGWNDWEGWSHVSQSSLKRALKIINPYIFVADKLLRENFEFEDRNFHHDHRYGFEEYRCEFKNDDNFAYEFSFKETANKDKTLVDVDGILNVIQKDYGVKGTRKNVKENISSEISLEVDFENKDKSSLEFRELKINNTSDIDRTSYCYYYKENGVILYDISMSLVSFLGLSNTKNAVELNLTTYIDSKNEFLQFDVSRNPMDGRLEVFLLVDGFPINLDVHEEDGNYFYYIRDYYNDPFGYFNKH